MWSFTLESMILTLVFVYKEHDITPWIFEEEDSIDVWSWRVTNEALTWFKPQLVALDAKEIQFSLRGKDTSCSLFS